MFAALLARLGISKIGLIAGGIGIVLIAGMGLYIWGLRAENALLEEQRNLALEANKKLAKEIETQVKAVEAANDVARNLRDKLTFMEGEYEDIRRKIDEASSAKPVDPVVRDTLQRLWSVPNR